MSANSTASLTSHPIAELIRSRRTIHEFTPQPAPRERVLNALELARWGPNHHLTEPWHFYWLGQETINAIAALNARLITEKKGVEAGQAKLKRWQAIPGWLAVTCDRSDDELRQREDYAACCCAIQNFMLALWADGIGVKWTTGPVTRHPEFYDLLWVDPEAELLVGLLWYGYPAEIPTPQRKPIDSVLVTLP